MTTDASSGPHQPEQSTVAPSSRDTSVLPTVVMDGPPPEPRRRGRVPARLVITGWVLALMSAVLVLVNGLTWSALAESARDETDRALTQEIAELQEFAQVGRDPDTGAPFTDVHTLITVYLERQYPAREEILFGWVDPLPTGPGSPSPTAEGRIRQGPEPLYDVSADPELSGAILDPPDARGTLDTPAGALAWEKILVHPPGEGPDGWFVIGYFTEPGGSEVAATVRTVALVSMAGLLLAGGAAWWVAGRVLAPVRLVRQAAAHITEEDLTRRIEVSGKDDVAALAEQFNHMLDRLEGAFLDQRRFLDDAGHELRTPITIVRGHLELMGDDPEERREVVRLVTDELDRMARIVEDLLLLAKARRTDFLRPEEVSLAELTSDIDAKARRLGDRDWRLEAVAEDTARLDPQRVTQAVVQLAANAVRHTEPGSTVRIGSTVSGSDVLIWVADRGPGIPPEDQGRIFERFARGGPAGSDRGAGLGLAIVRAIAEAHHGRVDLRSVPGRGSTFTLVVPLGRENA